MLKRLINDVITYYAYFIRAGKSELKSEVAFSHLSWLWWILDPLLFMLVYTFVHEIVFQKSEPYLAAFIFVGYNCYQFFERTLKGSIKLVAQNKSIVKNVYIPKPMLLFTKLYVNCFKFFISSMLVIVAMLLYNVKISWNIIYVFPLVVLLMFFSVSLGLFLMHLGVYIEDMSNIMNILLRLLFYVSGVFYNIDNRINDSFLNVLLLKCNPIAFIMNEMRKCLLYGRGIDFVTYLVWLSISFILFYIGISVVYKNENGYVKVI